MRKVSRKILIACRVVNTRKSALNLLNLVLKNHLVSGAFIFDLVDGKVESVNLLFKKILIDPTHIISPNAWAYFLNLSETNLHLFIDFLPQSLLHFLESRGQVLHIQVRSLTLRWRLWLKFFTFVWSKFLDFVVCKLRDFSVVTWWKIRLKFMFKLSDFFNLLFHLFWQEIEFLDFVLQFKALNLLNTFICGFGKEKILFLLFVLIVFGFGVLLQ